MFLVLINGDQDKTAVIMPGTRVNSIDRYLPCLTRSVLKASTCSISRRLAVLSPEQKTPPIRSHVASLCLVCLDSRMPVSDSDGDDQACPLGKLMPAL